MTSPKSERRLGQGSFPIASKWRRSPVSFHLPKHCRCLLDGGQLGDCCFILELAQNLPCSDDDAATGAHTQTVATVAPEALTATGWADVDGTGRYWRHERRFGPAVFDRFEAQAIEGNGRRRAAKPVR
jgi:hypothetical protein